MQRIVSRILCEYHRWCGRGKLKGQKWIAFANEDQRMSRSLPFHASWSVRCATRKSKAIFCSRKDGWVLSSTRRNLHFLLSSSWKNQRFEGQRIRPFQD